MQSSHPRAQRPAQPTRQTARPQRPPQRMQPPLSPEEELLRKQHVKMQTFRYKKERKKQIRLFFNRAGICLLLFAVLLAVSVGLFFLNLTAADSTLPDSVDFLMSATDGEGEKLKSISGDRLYIGGEPYLNMTDMAELYGFTTTGDRQKLRYITDLSRDENILVTLNSTEAVVNGMPIRLTSPCVKKDGEVYLPLAFFQTYVKGLNIDYSEKDAELTVTRIVIGHNGENALYESISFVLKHAAPCQAVSINDIP